MPQFFVGAAGATVVCLGASYGWYSEAKAAGSVLSVHSVILIAAGVGLLAAGLFVRRTALRLVELEKQLTQLQGSKT